MTAVTITVHDDTTPSAHYPTEEQQENGAVDRSVTIAIDGGPVIEGAITLYRDDANGGLGTCGTPLDGWCSGNVVDWLRTLTDRSRREAVDSLTGAIGTETLMVDVDECSGIN